MGSDVIDGTGKTLKGIHSSLTALFITESGFKDTCLMFTWSVG